MSDAQNNQQAYDEDEMMEAEALETLKRTAVATERIATALENVQRMFDSALTVLAEMDSVKGEEA